MPEIERLKAMSKQIFSTLKSECDKKIEIDKIDIYWQIESHCQVNLEDLDEIVTNHTLEILINRSIINIKNYLYLSIIDLFAPADSQLQTRLEPNVKEVSTHFINYLRYTKLKRERTIPCEVTDLDLYTLELAKLFIELYCPQNLPTQDLLSELSILNGKVFHEQSRSIV